MRVLACTLDTWESYQKVTGRIETEGLTFPLHIVEAIGKPYGLELEFAKQLAGHHALFLAVHDFSSMLSIGKAFRRLKLPLFSRDRGHAHPFVWAGGQGTRNPLPLADIVDLVVLGDAEDPLPVLLRLWERHGNSAAFLSAAATVPGVFVPSVHDETRDVLQMSFARDITASLARHIGITGEHARVEISRGCKSKCTFCGLGWMGPVRHNGAVEILEAINGAGVVHLQAGDAEAHPEIVRIRNAMRTAGQMDISCTSRLDSIAKTRNVFIYDKRFNFGIESVTERVRRKIGKPQLTNDFIIQAMCDVYASQRESNGISDKTDWHMIAGLPGESIGDCEEIAGVLRAIDSQLLEVTRAAGSLTIRWQPLFPHPGTPSQWLPAATGCAAWSRRLRGEVGKTFALKLKHQEGRLDRKNLLTTLLVRSGREGSRLIEAESTERVTPEQAEELTRASYRSLDVDAPLPWDFVRGAYDNELLIRAYRKMVR